MKAAKMLVRSFFVISLCLTVGYDVGSNQQYITTSNLISPFGFGNQRINGMSNLRLKEGELNLIRVPKDFPTIQSAIDAAVEGSQIIVEPGGVYKENLVIDKPLVLIGAGVILLTDPRQPAVHLNNSGAVTIDGFHVLPQEEFAGTRLGIWTEGGSAITLKHNKFEDFETSIQIDPNVSATIEENVLITDANGDNINGISVRNAKVWISNNKIYVNSVFENIAGIAAVGGDLTIQNNHVVVSEGNRRELAAALFLTNSQALISANRFITKNAEGLIIQGSQGIRIENNFISALESIGIDIHGGWTDWGSEEISIFNNVLAGGAESSSGIVIDGIPAVVESNMISGHLIGIYLSFGSQSVLRKNLIGWNQSHGVAISMDALNVDMIENEIIGNMGCGVSIEFALKSNLKAVNGYGNKIAMNELGDLCPPDYQWPANFRSEPDSN